MSRQSARSRDVVMPVLESMPLGVTLSVPGRVQLEDAAEDCKVRSTKVACREP